MLYLTDYSRPFKKLLTPKRKIGPQCGCMTGSLGVFTPQVVYVKPSSQQIARLSKRSNGIHKQGGESEFSTEN